MLRVAGTDCSPVEVHTSDKQSTLRVWLSKLLPQPKTHQSDYPDLGGQNAKYA